MDAKAWGDAAPAWTWRPVVDRQEDWLLRYPVHKHLIAKALEWATDVKLPLAVNETAATRPASLAKAKAIEIRNRREGRPPATIRVSDSKWEPYRVPDRSPNIWPKAETATPPPLGGPQAPALDPCPPIAFPQSNWSDAQTAVKDSGLRGAPPLRRWGAACVAQWTEGVPRFSNGKDRTRGGAVPAAATPPQVSAPNPAPQAADHPEPAAAARAGCGAPRPEAEAHSDRMATRPEVFLRPANRPELVRSSADLRGPSPDLRRPPGDVAGQPRTPTPGALAGQPALDFWKGLEGPPWDHETAAVIDLRLATGDYEGNDPTRTCVERVASLLRSHVTPVALWFEANRGRQVGWAAIAAVLTPESTDWCSINPRIREAWKEIGLALDRLGATDEDQYVYWILPDELGQLARLPQEGPHLRPAPAAENVIITSHRIHHAQPRPRTGPRAPEAAAAAGRAGSPTRSASTIGRSSLPSEVGFSPSPAAPRSLIGAGGDNPWGTASSVATLTRNPALGGAVNLRPAPMAGRGRGRVELRAAPARQQTPPPHPRRSQAALPQQDDPPELPAGILAFRACLDPAEQRSEEDLRVDDLWERAVQATRLGGDWIGAALYNALTLTSDLLDDAEREDWDGPIAVSGREQHKHHARLTLWNVQDPEVSPGCEPAALKPSLMEALAEGCRRLCGADHSLLAWETVLQLLLQDPETTIVCRILENRRQVDLYLPHRPSGMGKLALNAARTAQLEVGNHTLLIERLATTILYGRAMRCHHDRRAKLPERPTAIGPPVRSRVFLPIWARACHGLSRGKTWDEMSPLDQQALIGLALWGLAGNARPRGRAAAAATPRAAR